LLSKTQHTTQLQNNLQQQQENNTVVAWQPGHHWQLALMKTQSTLFKQLETY